MFAPTQSKSAAAPTIRPTTPFFQPKLTVNTPGDAYEQEADRVADQVMRMKNGDAPVVQRMPISPLSVQRKCDHCEKEEKAMRKETGGGDASGKAAPAAVSEVLSSGGGQPMDSSTRQWAESRFGQDFSQVRVHTDARAAESAAAIQARAYTSGSNVVFGAGEYQPQSESGQRLLAHELVHVGQQGGSEIKRQLVPEQTEASAVSQPQQQRSLFSALEEIPQAEFTDDPNVVRVPYQGKVYHVRRRVRRMRQERTQVPTNSWNSDADIDHSTAWMEVGWCTHGRQDTRGRVKLSTNAPEATREALRRVGDSILRGQDPGRALQGVELNGRADLEVTRSGNYQVNADLEASINPFNPSNWSAGAGVRVQTQDGHGVNVRGNMGEQDGQRSGGGSVEGVFNRPFDWPVAVVAQGAYENQGGRDGMTATVNIRTPIDRRPTTVECPMTTVVRHIPEFEYTCSEHTAEHSETTPATRYIYFEYATANMATHDSPTGRNRRRENEIAATLNDTELPAIQQLLTEGYTIQSIRGYTSPEGPLDRRQGRTFEGNAELATNRARVANTYLTGLCDGLCAPAPEQVTGAGELYSGVNPATGKELTGNALIDTAEQQYLDNPSDPTYTEELAEQLRQTGRRGSEEMLYPRLRRAEITLSRTRTIPASDVPVETCPPFVSLAAEGYFNNLERNSSR